MSQVKTIDQFLGALLALQFFELHERPTRRVVLFGNGGGTSVLATDSFAERGLDVAPFDERHVGSASKRFNLPPGTSVANPIDAPVATLAGGGGARREPDLSTSSTRPARRMRS